MADINSRENERAHKAELLPPPPPDGSGDLELADEMVAKLTAADLALEAELESGVLPTLLFDGYQLHWLGLKGAQWTAFSGPATENARESEKDWGPTPQGMYAIKRDTIQDWPTYPRDADWGNHRVRLHVPEPTKQRMRRCFRILRTDMYIHGSTKKGTIGCIEIFDEKEENHFFEKLEKYKGDHLWLEVRYNGGREKAYEADNCPYPEPTS